MFDLGQPLDIFEPAAEDITTTTEFVIPRILPPPLSAARRAQLDAPTLTDYNNMTTFELQKEMLQRKILSHVFHRRSFCVFKLQYSDRVDRDTYQKWKIRAAWDRTPDNEIELPLEPLSCQKMPRYKVDRILKLLSNRQDLMFASSVQEDITHKSFLHLPLEIRRMVYGFALDMSPMVQVKCFYSEEKDRFELMNAGGPIFCFFQKIYTVQTLAAMSKAMHQDVRSFFYGSIEMCLLNYKAGATSHFGISQRLLLKLGPEGAASLPRLEIVLVSQSCYEDGRYARAAYQDFLRSLSMCHSLRFFSLDLTVSHIFRSDVEAHQASFLRGEALKSAGLEELAGAIASHPNLDTVSLRLLPHVPTSQDDDFLTFAFSGIRQFILWNAIANRFTTNKVSYFRHVTDIRGLSDIIVNVHYPRADVYSDEDQIMNFFRLWKIGK